MLLHQYSIEYPTLAAIVRDAVAGMVVYGLPMPTPGYTVVVRRVNSRVAAYGRALSGR